jgi:subtilisin family serine protease
MYLTEYTGRGVRVAIVDSGVHAQHPHVREIEQGIGIREDGSLEADYVDHLGHGTAVAAAIREKAPDASHLAIKVFWRGLSTSVDSLVRAIDEAGERGASVVNLSLGTSKAGHRALLEAAVSRAASRGAFVVAAGEDAGVSWLPGAIDGVVPVTLDWECPRDQYRVISNQGRPGIAASGYPRDIPSVPRERNLKGISFAVANASAFLARAREAAPRATVTELLTILERAVPSVPQDADGRVRL